MSTGKKIAIGIAIGVVILFIGGCSSLVGMYNDLSKQEQVIMAQYKQNQNNYDNYFKKVTEVAQVPTMYVDDLKKVYDSAIQGRYGKDGSKAVFQFLKEQNPQLDSSMYIQIQRVIESGRNNFESNQTMLIDKKNIYETKLRQFPTNVVAGIMGFPKIDLSKYDIVTSEETEKAFETKKSAPLKLR